MVAQVNATPTRPLSFVVVAFSNELVHNILRSVCVNDPFNQLVLIDNTANLYYSNLSQAINAGLDRAHHELIVVVHEDVYLPPEWQMCFESSLKAIELLAHGKSRGSTVPPMMTLTHRCLSSAQLKAWRTLLSPNGWNLVLAPKAWTFLA